MAKNHPGYGDERWPFVTHFTGCKPCKLGASEDGENDECFKQMERAFNFADNQVLEKYGYTHLALSSFMTQKIRKDTSDPLGLQQVSAGRSKQKYASEQDAMKVMIEQEITQRDAKEMDLDE